MAAKGKKADYHLRLVQIKLRKNVCKSMDKMCKHQQLFDSRDAVVPSSSDAIRVARDEPESIRSFTISNCLRLLQMWKQ